MKILEPNWQEQDLRDSEYIRNLHPVFDTVLDTYKNVTAPPYVTGHITLWDVLQKIKYNLIQDITLQMFLTPKYINGELNTEYDALKEEQLAICYNASFDGYKNLKNTKVIHNLMFLDIDNFTSKAEALAYKAEIITKYDWILACSLSLSKIGLHVLVMVDKITNSRDYNRKYDYISKEYFSGILDPDSKSLSRFTILPYDNDIFITDNPVILPIDSIIQKSMGSVYNQSCSQQDKEKSMGSVYIPSNSASSNGLSGNESKSMGSVYIQSLSQHDNEKSMGSVWGGKGIYTTQTFSDSPNLNELLNTSARENGLVFKPFANEDLIEDPDKPLFNKNGFPVVEINLFLYSNKSVSEGRRTSFIGAIISQMIYLNAILPDKPNPDVRKNLLGFIRSVNRKYCNPFLPNDELLRSYNSHWKRYHEGKIDITKYLKLRKSLWSLNCSLTGNEKRSETMTRIHEYKREEKLEILCEAIQQMADSGEIITQQLVADEIKKRGLNGLGITTIKSLWKYFKPSVQEYKKGRCNEIRVTEPETKHEINMENLNSTEIDVDDDVLVLGAIESESHENNPLMEEPKKVTNEGVSLTEEQQLLIFNRIYSNILIKLQDEDKRNLYNLFIGKMKEFTSDERKILSTEPDKIYDSDTFWKQGNMENQLLNLCNQLKLSV